VICVDLAVQCSSSFVLLLVFDLEVLVFIGVMKAWVLNPRLSVVLFVVSYACVHSRAMPSGAEKSK